uniref:Uncharacterized protein n=1 Tax=Populus alba TaxID=43335 RepID=A0A4U5NKL6_POPAL|nr:hypothetical protein D5086_0000260010 [Populus alba]
MQMWLSYCSQKKSESRHHFTLIAVQSWLLDEPKLVLGLRKPFPPIRSVLGETKSLQFSIDNEAFQDCWCNRQLQSPIYFTAAPVTDPLIHKVSPSATPTTAPAASSVSRFSSSSTSSSTPPPSRTSSSFHYCFSKPQDSDRFPLISFIIKLSI